MYSITPRLSPNYSSNDELNKLLDSLDRKIGAMALCQLKNYKFGSNKPVDLDLYEDLLIYKEILLDKLLGCNCLEDARLIEINSHIRKLIR